MPVATIQYPGDIVNYNNNGGWHRQGKRAYRNAVRKIIDCLPLYREARLYHLCFEGKTHPEHMKMLHALRQMATRVGIQCEWFAAREVADDTKADHLHVFMLIDAHGNNVWQVFNQFDDGQVGQLCNDKGIKFAIFSPKDFQGIHGKNNYMALPYQGPGNRQTALGGKRLADALVWLTYGYKARSKPQDDTKWQIFPASRPARSRKAAPQAAQEPLDASVATQTVPSSPVDLSTGKGNQTQSEKASHEGITTPQCGTEGQSHTSTTESGHSSSSGPTRVSTGPRPRVPAYSASTGIEDQAIRSGQSNGGAGSSRGQTHQPVTPLPGITHRNFQASDSDPAPTTGETTMLTPAQKYIASRYEQAVGLRLNLDEVRAYLLAHGIKRTPAQVVHDLDETYQFYGYADSHAAPAHVSTAVLDKIIDRMPDRDIKLLPIPKATGFIGTKDLVAMTKRPYNGRNSQPTTGTTP
jgi:hypothetical protein